MLERLRGKRKDTPSVDAAARERVERVAVDAVLAAERSLGRSPEEKARNNPGFDVVSREGEGGPLLFIEVKGRIAGAATFTITKNEVLHALNKTGDYVLALVRVDSDRADEVRYIREPFTGNDDVLFGVTSLNLDWDEMFKRGTAP